MLYNILTAVVPVTVPFDWTPIIVVGLITAGPFIGILFVLWRFNIRINGRVEQLIESEKTKARLEERIKSSETIMLEAQKLAKEILDNAVIESERAKQQERINKSE